jgi:two-component system chemotaxis response regulator CheB
MNRPVRVLVVDDSALIRRVLTTGLDADPRIQVVGSAADPYEAVAEINRLNPDVLTLDIEMPRMDGITFLRKLLPQRPIPTIVVSTLGVAGAAPTLEALSLGAVEVVAKPGAEGSYRLPQMVAALREKVVVASRARVRVAVGARPPVKPSEAVVGAATVLVAIGASTGGPQAVPAVLRGFGPRSPGVVLTQHMPGRYMELFAHRLNEDLSIEARLAADGDRVRPGLALVAPGGLQMRVVRAAGSWVVRLRDEGPIGGHNPSIDALMGSVATAAGPRAIGVMLTGMGRDGAEGLAAMRAAGAVTLAQDEATSTVYGMPRAVAESGVAQESLPLHALSARVHALARRIARS